MRSSVFRKLKLLNNSFFYSLILNKKTVFNYVSLEELVFYIHKLSVTKKSWNRLILISQNINLVRLLGRNIEKKYFLNKILNNFQIFLKLFFSEQILFLTNENVIENKYLQEFIKIENKYYSNKKIINFYKKC